MLHRTHGPHSPVTRRSTRQCDFADRPTLTLSQSRIARVRAGHRSSTEAARPYRSTPSARIHVLDIYVLPRGLRLPRRVLRLLVVAESNGLVRLRTYARVLSVSRLREHTWRGHCTVTAVHACRGIRSAWYVSKCRAEPAGRARARGSRHTSSRLCLRRTAR